MNADDYQKVTDRHCYYRHANTGHHIAVRNLFAGTKAEIEEVELAYLYDNEFKVIENLGDLLWYVTRLASESGILLSELMTHNLQKCKQRFAEHDGK